MINLLFQSSITCSWLFYCLVLVLSVRLSWKQTEAAVGSVCNCDFRYYHVIILKPSSAVV